MKYFEKPNANKLNVFIFSFALLFPSVLNNPDASPTVDEVPADTSTTVNPKLVKELEDLCGRIYFDSDGSVCVPTEVVEPSTEAPEPETFDIVAFEEGMQNLREKLEFDQ